MSDKKKAAAGCESQLTDKIFHRRKDKERDQKKTPAVCSMRTDRRLVAVRVPSAKQLNIADGPRLVLAAKTAEFKS
jgi:hypothetical protein